MDYIQTKFNRFDGGKAYDKRSGASNQFGSSLNFDIRSVPTLLTPVRDYEADEGYNSVTNGIKASDLTGFGAIGNSIYAMGKKNDGTGRKMYTKSPSNSEWSDVTDALSADVESNDGCPLPGFIIRQFSSSGESVLWFVSGHSSTPISSFWMLGLVSQASGVSTSFSKKTLAFNPTIYPQGILGKDGFVYVASGSKLHKCSADGSISSDVFTVNTNWTITNLCLYGNYLAIAIYGQGRSKVILWDYSSSQASETIEWGEGALMVLENLDGMLVGITDNYINSTLFGSSASGDGSMQVKTWSGGEPIPYTEVKAATTVARAIEQFKYVKDNVLYWYAKIPLADGTYEEGIWSFGRRVQSQGYSLSLERQIAGTTFEGFWGVGDYLYFPHSGDGSVSRTSSTETYTLTSHYETLLINDSDSSLEKDAKGVVVSFPPFRLGQTLAVKYRKDGETTWTTATASPDIAENDIRAFYPLNFHFNEIEVRVETTNGLKISGVVLGHEQLTNGLV